MLLLTLALVAVAADDSAVADTPAASGPGDDPASVTRLQLTRDLSPANRTAGMPAGPVVLAPSSDAQRLSPVSAVAAIIAICVACLTAAFVVSRRVRDTRRISVESEDEAVRHDSLRARLAHRERQVRQLRQELAQARSMTVDSGADDVPHPELEAAKTAIHHLEALLQEQQAHWATLEARTARDGSALAAMRSELSQAAAIIETLHDDVEQWKQRALGAPAERARTQADADRLAGNR